MTFNLDNLVITVDKDVPQKRSRGTRGIDLQNDDRVVKLKALAIGDSFFLDGVERKDTRSIVNLGKKVGVYLHPRYVEEDEIYHTAGTRIWRVEEDELPRRGKGAKAPKADRVRYWHHPESSCVVMTGPGTGNAHFDTDNPGDGLVCEIDKEQYEKLKAEYEDDF